MKIKNMLLQIPALWALPAEFWAATAAFITGGALIGKKLLGRTPKAKPDYITRAEFHHEMTATRDRIGGGYLALADKLEANHKEVLAVIETQGVNFEQRLDRLETGLARVDERTKF